METWNDIVTKGKIKNLKTKFNDRKELLIKWKVKYIEEITSRREENEKTENTKLGILIDAK